MPTPEVAGTPRVFLHVGVPKTGTTFIQDVLWRGRSRLAREGVCYPLRRRSEHFAATMDLRGASWGGRHNSDWDGSWDRLAQTVVDSGASTAVLSGELLAAADTAAVARAVASFPGHEVHVVLTVRDLARQLVSGWQEHLKHRVSLPLDDFLAGCLRTPTATERSRRLGARFWQLHDLPEVAGRWASAVPVQRLHLVTVPPRATGRTGALWERFAAVTGIDASLGAVDTARPNTSLGAVEAELLRRCNASRFGELSSSHYDQVVRVLLAEKVLAGGDGVSLQLPARFADLVLDRSTAVVGSLAAAGYDVVGDLDDLVPDADALRSAADVVVGTEQLADASVRATAGLLTELGPLQRRLRSRRGGRPDPAATAEAEEETDAAAGPPGDAGAVAGVPGPVFVHVGAPKTGTTFLQGLMWSNREQLAAAGVRFARRRYGDHYTASLDLRQVADRPPGATGAWRRVVQDTAGWSGASVISHEYFAAARPEHVSRAVESLGAGRVHIVYTVRDLWGLLGAEWQESTKHGRALSFEAYLRDVLEHGRDGVVGRWFWSVHDPVDVLARWGRDVPPERVHVITVPPAGAGPDLLWERFAGVLGVDPAVAVADGADDPERANTSLGADEVTFLRRVNEQLGGRHDGVLPPGEYSRYVKTMLAQGILSRRPDKTGYAPPQEYVPLVRRWAQETVAGLRQAGYHVVGDLDDLIPDEPGPPRSDPDQVDPERLLEVGLDAVGGLVGQAAQLRAAFGFGDAPEPAVDSGAEARPRVDPVRRARTVLARVRSLADRRPGR